MPENHLPLDSTCISFSSLARGAVLQVRSCVLLSCSKCAALLFHLMQQNREVYQTIETKKHVIYQKFAGLYINRFNRCSYYIYMHISQSEQPRLQLPKRKSLGDRTQKTHKTRKTHPKNPAGFFDF